LPHNTPDGSNVDDDDGTPFAVPDDFPSCGAVWAIGVTTTFAQTLELVASFFVVVIDVDNEIDDDDDEPSGGLRKTFTGGEGSGAAHAVFLCLDPSFFSSSNS
jgi:hypothetical protein